jgi:hypothetical protein
MRECGKQPACESLNRESAASGFYAKGRSFIFAHIFSGNASPLRATTVNAGSVNSGGG